MKDKPILIVLTRELKEFLEKNKALDKYLCNVQKQNGYNRINLLNPSHGFHWAKTKEGHEYWALLYKQFSKKYL